MVVGVRRFVRGCVQLFIKIESSEMVNIPCGMISQCGEFVGNIGRISVPIEGEFEENVVKNDV